MADNVTAKANTGTGTEVLATDEIGGIHYPRSKIVIGADGVNDGDVSAANPLPVTGPLTDTELRATAVPVSGTVTANAGSGTFAVSGPVTDAQLRASAVPVSVSDPSVGTAFGPIAAADTVLFTAVDTAGKSSIQLQITGRFDRGGVEFQSSMDGTNYQSTHAPLYDDTQLESVLYSPDLVTIPLQGRYFRAITTANFAGSISGTYTLRGLADAPHFANTKLVDIESGVSFPVSGVTPAGYVRRIAVAENGGVVPADGAVIQGSRQGASVGPIVQFETTGYSAISLQLANVFTGTVTFQASNEGSTWVSVAGWPSAGGTAPVTTATAVGQWVFPVTGRFFRAQITTGGSGVVAAIAVLKNGFAFYPASTPSVTIAANSSVNVAQVAGTNTVTGGVAGIQAVGGNIAVGAAPTANPVPMGGWDGTNTRRILTDAVSGGIALGASGVSSGASVGTLIAAGSNNLTQIKGTIGRLFFFHVRNQVASVRYVKLFNLPSASVTMGTTNATMNFMVPASGELNLPIPSLGLNMGGTGISFALVTGEALNNNTAVTASDLIVNYSWA